MFGLRSFGASLETVDFLSQRYWMRYRSRVESIANGSVDTVVGVTQTGLNIISCHSIMRH